MVFAIDDRRRHPVPSEWIWGDNFPAKRRSDRRRPIGVASITLPRSPVSLSSGDEVPHIFTRKSRLQPGEFLITSTKRLLQQYRPQPDSCSAAKVELFDHLVGAAARGGRHGAADRRRPLHLNIQQI